MSSIRGTVCDARTMFEIADRLLAAFDAGQSLAIATAISIEGSAPRTVGTSMAFDGTAVIGTIAGGCVEGAVVEQCALVLADGVTRTVEYGVSDETAMSVGLTCGGQLRIVIQAMTDATARDLRDGATIATVVSGAPVEGGLARQLDTERIARSATGLSLVECDGAVVEVFFEVATPRPRMIIFGAMEFSVALAAAADVLGYRVTVCDPRSLFATRERFPTAELAVQWPTTYLASTEVDDRTAICVLSHDARFDAELIAQALELPVAYVGAMGSRLTHDRRVASLRERGVPEASIERLRSPIGLDLGASTPAETAVSILAEVLAARTGSSGRGLRETAGPIHATQGRVSFDAPLAP